MQGVTGGAHAVAAARGVVDHTRGIGASRQQAEAFAQAQRAGGADDGTGRPAGYAWDNGARSETAGANDIAVGFGKFVDVFTGGGDYIARGKAKNAGYSAFQFQSLGDFILM